MVSELPTYSAQTSARDMQSQPDAPNPQPTCLDNNNHSHARNIQKRVAISLETDLRKLIRSNPTE